MVINNADAVDFENEKENYAFEYSETNGYFEYDELNSDDGSFNLVLESGSLNKGESYQFELKAFYIGVTPYVEMGSSSVNIYVNEGPSIEDGSFIFKPDCSDSDGIELSSFSDLFDLTFDLSVDAFGESTPLFYQFSYIIPDSGHTIPTM